MAKVLLKGNEALAEAALAAGCRFYSGYPITPQTEILEYLSWRMEDVGGVFIQAESELAGINMVLGAAAAGARALTTSSGPGFSLKQEGISYLAGAELPCLIVNVMRGGPGLGTIQPSQADYFQAVILHRVRETTGSLQEVVVTEITIHSYLLRLPYRKMQT